MIRPVVALINDERTFRYIVSRELEEAGFEVVTAALDNDAIETIRQTRPAAIVIETDRDRGLAGTFMVEYLRRNAETRHVPMILCSADAEFLEDHRSYLVARNCQLMGKPFSTAVLADRLRDAIRPLRAPEQALEIAAP